MWDISRVEIDLKKCFDDNSEADLLRVLKGNSFLFYFLFIRKGGIQPIFSEVELGQKLRCDFAWLNDNSNGPEWTLVEVEKPKMRIFNADRTPSSSLNKALDQVKSWRQYFAENPAEKKKIFGAVSRFRFVLVAGDKGSWADEYAARWRMHNNGTSEFEIRTTDVFLRALDEMKARPGDFWSFKNNPVALEFRNLEGYWKNYGYMDRWRSIIP
jgi:hypothetical protein